MTRSGGMTEANRQAVAHAVLRLLSEGRLNFDFQNVARRWPSTLRA
jgi:hypothetical protein